MEIVIEMEGGVLLSVNKFDDYEELALLNANGKLKLDKSWRAKHLWQESDLQTIYLVDYDEVKEEE